MDILEISVGITNTLEYSLNLIEQVKKVFAKAYFNNVASIQIRNLLFGFLANTIQIKLKNHARELFSIVFAVVLIFLN